jgi:hypothetical protein
LLRGDSFLHFADLAAVTQHFGQEQLGLCIGQPRLAFEDLLL